MGRLYREKEVHGVKVIYVEDHKVRVCTKVWITGRRAWMMLPDGRVGCSEVEFFKYAYVGVQKKDVWAAEALWRLGAIKKDVFLKVQAAQKKHEDKRNRGYAVDEFKTAAQKLGIKLTAEQARVVA